MPLAAPVAICLLPSVPPSGRRPPAAASSAVRPQTACRRQFRRQAADRLPPPVPPSGRRPPATASSAARPQTACRRQFAVRPQTACFAGWPLLTQLLSAADGGVPPRRKAPSAVCCRQACAFCRRDFPDGGTGEIRLQLA